ncbi:polyhomeotic-like protein 1 isoform X3 [Nerophis ophidion]|uniref:polyhomeotic-like protein 1 isoform X3 n=1 Tax=Nerophis ophidion TaxID=159077 RepID=UPI002ADF4FD5|nr:polyhomeotic-like protein 1 isoform X3 [Nerophis ophidion]
MDTGDEKNQPQEASANDSALSGTSARSSAMNSMSLYERQAVQALQALQRQPHAAQYFQQLMLQQHINKAQLQNLAAVQQVQASLAAGCQPSQSGGSPSQTAVTSAACATSSSASTASNRPVGVSATTTISQSVLLGGGAGGRGQMYLRVNRSLRAPISPQLIFMRGNTATAAVATLPQLPQPRKPEIAATSSSGCQTDSDQVQNLTVRNVSGPKCVKTERSDAGEPKLCSVKEATSILKRKLDEDGPSRPQSLPVKNCSSVLTSVSMETDSAPPPAYPTLPVSRSGCARREKAPPPQAVIKPHVLTHLIEGFVIQEGPEPFPVCGTIKDSAVEDQSVTTTIVLKCEYCKKFAPASQFRGTKRFCSMLCAKRYNVSFRQPLSVRHAQECHQPPRQDQLSHSDEDARVARRSVPRRTSSEIASAKIAGRSLPVTRHSESSHSDTESSGEEEEDNPMSLSPASLASCHAKETPSLSSQSSSPAHWSVDQVSQYISSLQGCEELALHFLSQEIDGQALLLLKEEHLMSTMNIKLGPALKICAHINNLRD